LFEELRKDPFTEFASDKRRAADAEKDELFTYGLDEGS
jgi:hypothetical protein